MRLFASATSAKAIREAVSIAGLSSAGSAPSLSISLVCRRQRLPLRVGYLQTKNVRNKTYSVLSETPTRTPKRSHRSLSSATTGSSSSPAAQPKENSIVPLYRSQGVFSVIKPLEWTSNDVVSFLRKMLMREARERGAKPVHVDSRRNKSRKLKVGHGGTLDPLATGVLVIGVGTGTKELQTQLSGSKSYRAEAELGFETTTLDMDKTGAITKTAPYEHITVGDMEHILPAFVGTIKQVPPMYSAIRMGGKRLHEKARQEGLSEADVNIEAREVVIHRLELLGMQGKQFSLAIECGGGTYVRSLIRDIAHKLDSVATMTSLERTQQSQFTLENSLAREDWSPDSIYAAIDKWNAQRQQDGGSRSSPDT